MTIRSSEWPVYGHDWAVQLLQRAALDPRHAYLLTGARHLGKTTLGRAFAQALLCMDGAPPCGQCRACRLMARAVHPDFRLVSPTAKGGAVDRNEGMLRADQANDIVREVVMRPVEGRCKVFLLQDVHTAHDAFVNKLLKTLEEPPAGVVLILTASDRSTLPPTITSRCQVLELRPLDSPTIEAALQKGWGASPDEAALLARLAQGRLGWAAAQLRTEGGEQRRAELRTLWSLIEADRIERLAFAETLAAGRTGGNLFALLEQWTVWWRDVMLIQSGCFDACSNIDLLAEAEAQAQSLSPAAVRAFLHTLARTEEYLHHTVNTRLALDVLLLRLPRRAAA